jgi:hypothetical protein
MSSIVIQGDTSGSITVEAPSVAGTHTLTLPKATGTVATNATVGLGTKNRIINGDMRIAQRGTSFSNPTSGFYTLDRWYIRTQNASVVSTITQSTTAPTGFINSFYLSIGTGAASGSTDRAQLYHGLEGLNVSDFGWGTANAKTVTLSFWVRSSLTGQFGGAIQNSAGNRSYPFTYTISSANTWEQKTVTVAGDTTGTWTTDNGLGIQLNFDLGAGSSFLTTAGSWAAGDYRGATGDTSIVATSGATWYITGIQLETSTEATPFENRMYSTELAMCKRYYQLYGRGPVGIWSGSTNIESHFIFSPEMRATPTFTVSGGTVNISNKTNGNTGNCTPSVVNFGGSNKGASYAHITNANITSPSIGHLAQFRTDDWMRFDAEL